MKIARILSVVTALALSVAQAQAYDLRVSNFPVNGVASQKLTTRIADAMSRSYAVTLTSVGAPETLELLVSALDRRFGRNHQFVYSIDGKTIGSAIIWDGEHLSQTGAAINLAPHLHFRTNPIIAAFHTTSHDHPVVIGAYELADTARATTARVDQALGYIAHAMDVYFPDYFLKVALGDTSRTSGEFGRYNSVGKAGIMPASVHPIYVSEGKNSVTLQMPDLPAGSPLDGV